MPLTAKPWLAPLALVLVGAAMFSTTHSDAVQIADSGEMISAACNLGVPHPPGYPLAVLLGHLSCQLPWSTEAGRVGLVSLLAGLWTLLAVYGVVLRLTDNRMAGVAAALTLACGDIFWRYSSQAEVFTLNTALCLSLVYAALALGQARGRAALGWAAATGLALGLATSNHLSAVWVAPLAVVAVLLPGRPLGRCLGRVVAASLGVALGLSPYLHLLWADLAVVPRWGQTDTLAGLLHHFLRRDYGTLSLAQGGQWAPAANLWHFVSRVPSQTAWVLWPVALLGLAALFYRAARRPLGRVVEPRLRRDLAATLGLLPLLAGPAFMLMFNIADDGISRQVTERFFMLPVALLCVCLGVGLALLHATFLAGPQARERALLWQGVTLVVLLLAGVGAFRRADASQRYAVEDFALNSLNSVKRGALIIGAGDVTLFSLMYAQHVLGVRPDVQYADVYMLLYPWYVEQKQRERPGFSYSYQRGHVNTLGLIQRELSRGVPVYLSTIYNKKVLKAYQGYPVGPLIRLVPPGQRAPHPRYVAQLNRRLFKGFSRRGQPPEPELDPWSASLQERYAGTWRSLGHAQYRSGDRRAALRSLTMAHRWAPWLKLPRWFGELKPRRKQPGKPTLEQLIQRNRAGSAKP